MNGTPLDPDGVTVGTSNALETLVLNHRVFLQFLERRVGNRATAEDILQHAFVRGMDRLPQLKDQESVVAWFYRVLRNAVVDHHRANGAAARAGSRLALEMQDAVEPAPEFQAEACRCVMTLAATLKQEYAAALQAVDVEGSSVTAYAQLAGITANNASVRLFRARDALRRQVMASCGTCAEHGCLDCSCARSAPAGDPTGPL